MTALAIVQHPVGRVGGVEAEIGARAIILDDERRTADDRRAGCGFERGGGGRMIAVGMGADDGGDALARENVGERADMRRVVAIRSGIDHGDIASADNIGLRAGIAERRCVAREHAADARADVLRSSVGQGAEVGNIHGGAYSDAAR